MTRTELFNELETIKKSASTNTAVLDAVQKIEKGLNHASIIDTDDTVFLEMLIYRLANGCRYAYSCNIDVWGMKDAKSTQAAYAICEDVTDPTTGLSPEWKGNWDKFADHMIDLHPRE